MKNRRRLTPTVKRTEKAQAARQQKLAAATGPNGLGRLFFRKMPARIFAWNYGLAALGRSAVGEFAISVFTLIGGIPYFGTLHAMPEGIPANSFFI